MRDRSIWNRLDNIQKLQQNRDDQILVRAIAEIAKGFGKKTVAEYVEDEETLNLLRDYHVDYAQGFHIGKPVTMTLQADAMGNLLI